MSEYGPYSNHEEASQAYDELLDETYPAFEMGYMSYNPSAVLKAVDYTAYLQGFNEWLDSVVTEYEEENQPTGNPYRDPDDNGLMFIGEVSWSDEPYEFDLTAVWFDGTGTFYWSQDSGCSCPAPFENLTYEYLFKGTKFDLLAVLTKGGDRAMPLIERIMQL